MRLARLTSKSHRRSESNELTESAANQETPSSGGGTRLTHVLDAPGSHGEYHTGNAGSVSEEYLAGMLRASERL